MSQLSCPNVTKGNSKPFGSVERNYYGPANAPMLEVDETFAFLLGSPEEGYSIEAIQSEGGMQVMPALTFAVMASTISDWR